MCIEDNSDDSYSCSTESVSSYSSMSDPISSMTDDSTKVKDVSSNSEDDQRDSSWDSKFQDEAEIIARFIRFMRDQSGSISSESDIPSSISSYLPVPAHTYDDDNDFTPLSFVDDSDPYSSDINPNCSFSGLDLSDQTSPISTGHNSSDENLHSTKDQTSPINAGHNSSEEILYSTRDQTSPINADHNSSEENLESSRDQTSPIITDHTGSEEDLHSSGSEQNQKTSSLVCKLDQSIQVDMSQVTSEEDIQSDISTSSNSTIQQIERPFFTTRSGKIYYKNI